MPAATEVGQYEKEEMDELEQWAREVGISMNELADQILQSAERRIRSRRSARCASEASSTNVVAFGLVG